MARALKEADIKPALKLATRATKELVIAGVNGDEDFPKLLAKYTWTGTRDYNMALIIIAFYTYCIKSKKDADLKKFGLSSKREGSNSYELLKYLKEGKGNKVKDCMNKQIFKSALDAVLMEAIPNVEDTEENSKIQNKKNQDKRAKIIKSFINQAGKITSWKINGKDIGNIIGELTNSKSFDLFYAADHNDVNLAKLLLQNGADPNAKNNNNDTALHVAAKRGAEEIIDMLLKNDADPNILNDKNQIYTDVMYKENPLKKCGQQKRKK